jgi:holo-[acyl-carrier protein] synthase
VFAPNELDHIKGSPNRAAQEYLAGRFAVKEAVLKALRIGIGDEVSMCDIYTSTSVDGAPELHLTASALRAAEARTLSNWQVSISHENGMAIAFVIAL